MVLLEVILDVLFKPFFPQGEETLLAPFTDKQTRSYYAEYYASESLGLIRKKIKRWAIYIKKYQEML